MGIEQDGGSRGASAYGQTLVFIGMALAGALVIHQFPLDSSRPNAAEPAVAIKAGANEVEARLWQDPFGPISGGVGPFPAVGAIASGGEAQASPGRSGTSPLCDAELSRGSDDEPPLVIAPFVSLGGYTGSAESRRRTRYAVVSALHASGFQPMDEWHLHYWRHEFETGNSTDVPYEWFERPPGPDPKSPTRALVLWLGEDHFESTIAPKLNALRDRLLNRPEANDAGTTPDGSKTGYANMRAIDARPLDDRRLESRGAQPRAGADCSVPKGWNDSLRIRVLGPNSSHTLLTLVRERQPAGAAGDTSAQGARNAEPCLSECEKQATAKEPQLVFYPYGATVDDKLLLTAAGIREIQTESSVNVLLQRCGILLYRTIATDSRLAIALRGEIQRRLDPQCPDTDRPCAAFAHRWPHIALVSEWDTFYGRSLATSIRQALGTRAQAEGPDPDASAGRHWLHEYGYLRGLDGQTAKHARAIGASARESDRGSASSPDDARARSADRPRESADGDGQFDYLRRLSVQLLDADARARESGGRGIEAIGVLGSDPYDKRLILQALRPKFPTALFFTTDLDARLFEHEQLAWSRNLVVASSFGLQLRDALQADIPPFRESYQTAAFLATRIAVTHGVQTEATRKAASVAQSRPTTEDLDRWLATPLIFEVGRSGAFQLTRFFQDTETWPGDCRKRILCNDIQPPGGPFFPRPARDTITIALAAIFCVSLAIHYLGSRKLQWYLHRVVHRARRDSSQMGYLCLVLVGVGASIVGVAYLLAGLWPSLANWLTESGAGEPMLLTEGLSLWPTEFLHLGAALLSCYLLFRGWKNLERNSVRIARAFRMQVQRQAVIRALRTSALGHRWWDLLVGTFSYRIRKHPVNSAPPATATDRRHRLADAFWKTYIYEGRLSARVVRVTLLLLVFLAFGYTLAAVFGHPTVPTRGERSQAVHVVVTWISVISTQFLILAVVDSTAFCCRFIVELKQIESGWPDSVTNFFAAKFAIRKRYLKHWIDLNVIAERTKCIAQVIYYPFIVISVMVVSRASIFANWGFPMSILLLHGFSIAIAVTCAVALRRCAESARRASLRDLGEQLLRAKRMDGTGRIVAQLETLIDMTTALRVGAFAPFSEQPVVRAVLLLLGALGSSSLLGQLSLLDR